MLKWEMEMIQFDLRICLNLVNKKHVELADKTF